MNLLKKMQEEITSLNLKDELEIIRYLYIRIGQIFDYDPRFDIVDVYAKEKIAKKRIAIENVNEFDIVCETLNYLFVDLLKSFGIEAKVIKSGIPKFHHSLVEITTKNYGILYADLMIGLYDLCAIKLGREPINMSFANATNNGVFEQIDKNIHYKQKMTFEEAVALIQVELANKEFSSDEQLQKTFKGVADIINFPRSYSIGYCSGTNSIYEMLLILTGKKYASTQFYNLENNEFIEIYPIVLNHKTLYYSYEKNNDGVFQFHPIKEGRSKRLSSTIRYTK